MYAKPFSVRATLKDGHGAILVLKDVSFLIDGNVIGTATTNVGGVATLSVPTPSLYGVGTHTLSCSFAGDAHYYASVGTSTLTVTPTNTKITLNSATGKPGNTRTFSVKLTRTSDGGAVAGATITFRIDGNVIGMSNTDGLGKANFSYIIDEVYTVGTHTVTADFGGDGNDIGSLAKSTLTIQQATSKIRSLKLSAAKGATVTLTAILTRTTDNGAVANRKVRFQIDGADVGSGTTDANGNATLSYSIPNDNMFVGNHTITVLFDGDNFYTTSTGGSLLTVR